MACRTMQCDRGKHDFIGEQYDGVTAGFYDVSGGPWQAMANPGELVVCDACMHSDPRYIAVYGKVK